MIQAILIYVAAKVVISGASWLLLSSPRKNIAAHIEALKLKPSSRKRPRTRELSIRLKVARMIPTVGLIPGIGELGFIAITVGRFSNKAKITEVYEKALNRMDYENLEDAVDVMGQTNASLYKTLRKEAGFLSVQGHSEIAKQSVLTLNNLLIDANLAGINLKTDPSIASALHDTAELVSNLLVEEHSGIQSNIDKYLNVVGSIKSDLADKKSVFMDEVASDVSDRK